MDLFFVPTPKSMARAVLSTVAQATTALPKSNADFRNVMQVIPNFTVSPVPMTWHPDGLLFMGDDPTCPNREPKPFVQSSIAYDVSCSVQQRHTMLLHKSTVCPSRSSLHLYVRRGRPHLFTVPNVGNFV
ncbi:hypothetical protein DYB36_012392 [Aphanomyces astaci]|uniref:Uncharacterized protein n=1 Tax=Aphanomyces astaci TaxID=112090 RepID=A0A396ZY89_APHAT|nr:hypothetical protein DYB36_012392 [Aphanomyces astaci]